MSQPDESLWMKLMREYGQKVYMSSPTPFLYQTPTGRPLHDYTALGLQGRFDEAETIAKTLQPLREIAAKWMRSRWVNEKLIPIAYIKAWSELLGMAGGPVRTPLPQITDQERQALRAELEKTGILSRVKVKQAA